jgi:hypothetical protein
MRVTRLGENFWETAISAGTVELRHHVHVGVSPVLRRLTSPDEEHVISPCGRTTTGENGSPLTHSVGGFVGSPTRCSTGAGRRPGRSRGIPRSWVGGHGGPHAVWSGITSPPPAGLMPPYADAFADGAVGGSAVPT